MNSRIYHGWVRHRRMAPAEHAFRYRIFLLYLDLSELDGLFKGRWLWSSRRPSLAWFDRRDHLGDANRPLASEVRDLVEAQTGQRPSGRITLLTHLRYFGYCMNPVSFYYCWSATDGRLEAIVAEVNNTPWGERHCYVLDCQSRDQSSDRLRFAFTKEFHVSPFMPMEQEYDWRFSVPAGSLSVHMQSYESGSKTFDATMRLDAIPINGRTLAKVLISYPFMTGRVILAIYWQALRLWRKGVPFHTHPKNHVPGEAPR